MPLRPPSHAALFLAVAMTMAATSSRELAGPEARATLPSSGNGDRIRTAGQQRITIRLTGIDTPEMAQVPSGAIDRCNLQKVLPLDSNLAIRVPGHEPFHHAVTELVNDLT